MKERFWLWATAAKAAAATYRGYYFPTDEHPRINALLYSAMLVAVVLFSLSSILAPLLVRDCVKTPPEESSWSNPLYPGDECFYVKRKILLGQSLLEANVIRRMVTSVLLAVPIGYERRSPDRSAGIKLMILVSLGSCSFTISSIYSFESSTSGYDTARVAAAIVSGVGFLASAMIYKGGDMANHTVYGLTTAASVWVAAAVGISSGGELYFAAMYTAVLVVIILRFMPRADQPTHADQSISQGANLGEVKGEEKELVSVQALPLRSPTPPIQAHQVNASQPFEQPVSTRSDEHIRHEDTAAVREETKGEESEEGSVKGLPSATLHPSFPAQRVHRSDSFENSVSEPALLGRNVQELSQAEIDQDLDDFLEITNKTPCVTGYSSQSSNTTIHQGSIAGSASAVPQQKPPPSSDRQPSIVFR